MIEQLIVDHIRKTYIIYRVLNSSDYVIGHFTLSSHIGEGVFQCLWDGDKFLHTVSLSDPDALEKIMIAIGDSLQFLRGWA